MSSLGQGRLLTLPPTLWPHSVPGTQGVLTRSKEWNLVSALCAAAPESQRRLLSTLPSQASSPVFHLISDELESEHQLCPRFVLSLVEAGWRLLLRGAPPGGRWEGGQDEAPPESALLSQGPKLLRQESVGLQAQNPYSWLCDRGHVTHRSEPPFLYSAAADDAGSPLGLLGGR